MIQILGLRDFTAKGRTQKREVFFNKNYRADKIEDIFNSEKLDALLKTIPKEDQWNLYFTVADCFEERIVGEKGRKLKEQWAIPFDIDGIHIPSEDKALESALSVARLACEALNVEHTDVGILFSGNGVQIFVLTDKPILAPEYFDTTRLNYAALCNNIQLKLRDAQVHGKVDTSVWSSARLMRLPNTENRKPGKPVRTAQILNGTLKPLSFDVVERSGITAVNRPEYISDEALKDYPKPDTDAVCTGCKFLVHCKENPSKISEPQWYAMNSITARLNNGDDLTHAMSEGHPSYSHYETELKIAQALAASGPRTCKNIESLWDGCTKCDHYGKITSPIMIKGDDYIASADFGFRERKITEGKKPQPGRPVYTDLIKQFMKETPYKTLVDNGCIYVFNGKHWELMEDPFLRKWMTALVTPTPSTVEMREFIGQLKAYNTVRMEWFNDTRTKHLNFSNCVLNLDTMETHPHHAKYGFFSVLPFNYDPKAQAPRWEQFLSEIMQGDSEMVELLKEYGGYAISGDDCWMQKSLILVGEGANGKSTYMEMLGEVVGRDAHSAVSMQDMNNPQSRYSVMNKLFNYSEETSMKAIADSSIFKTLVSGGMIEIKQLYTQPFMIPNRAKLIMAANNMPYSSDKSFAMYRRMLIVYFNARFDVGHEGHDPHLRTKLREELPGICNSLIKAYTRARSTLTLSGAERMHKVIRSYQLESDNVARFFNEQVITVGEVGYELTAEVYQAYVNFCEFENEDPVSRVSFGKQVARVAPQIAESRGLVWLNGTAQRVYKGIKLNKEF